MADARLASYARVLLDTCVKVEPGWQVLVASQPAARPLIEELTRQLAGRGAYALQRLEFEGLWNHGWLREAPEELLGELPPIQRNELENIDAIVAIVAPENTRDGSDVPTERLARYQAARREIMMPFLSDEKPWVGCQFPTHALAQDAGLTLPEFEECLYAAVLVDWDALAERLGRIKERFDGAPSVRIVGRDTDLTFSLAGREGLVDAGGANMPGGEVFYSPVEDSAEGVVTFGEFPGVYMGHQVPGIRFRFEGGRIVEASAAADEEFLLSTLDTDEGSRRLGEFGIGGNPGITRHFRNTLFDEKIDGTVHLAIGQGFPQIGGTNGSAVHWDIVKELRSGGELYVDGELVQRDGTWSL
jgi:aminopeptidase